MSNYFLNVVVSFNINEFKFSQLLYIFLGNYYNPNQEHAANSWQPAANQNYFDQMYENSNTPNSYTQQSPNTSYYDKIPTDVDSETQSLNNSESNMTSSNVLVNTGSSFVVPAVNSVSNISRPSNVSSSTCSSDIYCNG